MASNRIVYTLDFKANFNDIQGQLNRLRMSLNDVASMKFNSTGNFLSKDLQAASQAAVALKSHLKSALDPSTGRLDLARFQTQLVASGQSAQVLATNLVKAGGQGIQTFNQLSNAILNAQKPMMRFGTLARSLGQTLMNTVKWQISSRLLYGVVGALSNAVRYASDLDGVLNDIRIVTGNSRREMEAFAKKANETAVTLGSSTKKVAEANLIYRQQGDTATEAYKKAQITIKAANAAGTEAKEMSEYLTGIWNSYQVGADSLELFVDKLVRVGATTATSSEELATAMTKVAATANAVGVTYDQLLSTISTVSAATRLSAEQVGTAFKTIYARMGDLELEGSITDGDLTTTLGSISSQLKQVGVDVIGANGSIKDMGLVVEELGTKWSTLTMNQKTAIAEAVAGKRQYTQLFALFENWDEYKRTMGEAADAQGELTKQQLIYMDSVEGAKARLTAAKEDFIIDVFNPESVQSFYNIMTEIVKIFDKALENVGGIGDALLLAGSIAMMKFAPQISQGVTNAIGGAIATIPYFGQKASQKFLSNWINTISQVKSLMAFESPVDNTQLDVLKNMTILTDTFNAKQKELTAQKRQQLEIAVQMLKTQHEENLAVTEMRQLRTAQDNQTQAETAYRNTMGIGNQRMNEFLTGQQLDLSHVPGLDVLKENLGSTKASITDIVHAFTGLRDEAGNIPTAPLQALANYLNNGRDASEEMVLSLGRVLDTVHSTTEAEGAVVYRMREFQGVIANVLTEMTGVTHIFDSTTGNIITTTMSTEEWKAKTQELESAIKNAKAQLEGMSDEGKIQQLKQKIAELTDELNKLRGIKVDIDESDANNDIEALKQKIADLKQQAADKRASAKSHYDESGTGIKNAHSMKPGKKTKLTNRADNIIDNAKNKKDLKELQGLTGETRNKIEKDMQGVFDTEKDIAKAEKRLKKLEGPNIKDKVEGTTQAIGGLGSAVMGASMMFNSLNTIMDENASIGQKVMSFAMMLTSITTVLNGVNSLSLGLQKAWNIAKIKEIALDKTKNLLLSEKIKLLIIEKALSSTGLVVTALAIGAVVGITKLAKSHSQAAKEAKKFEAASKSLEKTLEKYNQQKEEVKTLDELSDKLRQAQGDKEALAAVTDELNKKLGTEFDLVHGGAAEYERASALLKKRNADEKEYLETLKEEALVDAKTKLASGTFKSSGRGGDATATELTAADARYVLEQYNNDLSESQKKALREGGSIDLETKSAGTERFTIAEIQEAQNIIEDSAEEVMGIIDDNLTLSLVNQDSIIKVAQEEMEGDDFADFYQAMSDNSEQLAAAVSSGNIELAQSIYDSIRDSIPSDERGVLEVWDKEVQQAILDMEDIEKNRGNEEYDRTSFAAALADFKTLGKKNMDIIEDFNENGGVLTEEGIEKYIKDLSTISGLNLSAEDMTEIENFLRDPNLNEATLKSLLDSLTSRTLNTTDIWKNAIEGETEQLKKILGEYGVANADEVATEIMGIGSILKSVKDDVTEAGKASTELIEEDLTSALEQLQNQYGYTAQQAEGLIVKESIINNTNLNLGQRIAKLKEYANTIGFVDSELSNFVMNIDPNNQRTKWDQLTDKEKTAYEKLGMFGNDDKGNITMNGQAITTDVAFEATGKYLELESQYNFDLELAQTSERELNKLRKDHLKEMKEWEKDNIIEKIKDSILELEEAIEHFNRTAESLDFIESLYGEETPIDVYVKKVENFKNITKESMENWNELMAMESDNGEGMEEILDAKKSTLETWRQSILDAREAEDQLYDAKIQLVEEAGTGLTNVIEKQHELISITLEGMQKLLEMNEQGESSVSKKGALASMIGQVLGALSEYDKEIKEQERAQKKRLELRNEETQQILEMNQKMEDEINKYALDALKQGITDRQTERDIERQEIIEDFNETANTLETRMQQAYDKVNNMWKPLLEQIRETLGLLSGDVSATDTELTKKFTTPQDVNYDPLLKGDSQVLYADKENNTVKIRNWSADGKDSRVYYYKFDGGTVNDIKAGTKIDSSTVLATGTSGYTITKSQSNVDEYGTKMSDLEKERFGYKPSASDVKSYKITNVSGSNGNHSVSGELLSQYGNSIGTFSITGLGNGYALASDPNNTSENLASIQVYNDPSDYSKGDVVIGEGLTYEPNNIQKLKSYGSGKISYNYGYAKGSDSTPAGEAWVGELGRELIILPDGKVVMAGEDGIELANLPAGARVLTNEETEKILKDKKDYTNVQESEVGFAQGTQFHVNEQNLTQETVEANEITFEDDVENYKAATDEKLNIQDEFKKETNQNLSDIESATIQKNKEIKDNTITSLSALDTTTKGTASNIEGYINDMKFVIPKIDSKEFIDSLEKLIDDSLRVVYEDQDITITDASGNTHTGKYSSGGVGGSELGEIRGSSVEIGQGITTYDDLFVKHGKAYGIDPRFLKAICGIETNFGKNINTSSAGAKGLMQFIDSTAKTYGVDVTDPDSSVRGAAQYLSELLAKYNGDLILAGRAYNGGTPNKAQENLNYGKMLEECFGKNATNENLLKTSKIKVSSFAELLANIAGLNTNFIEENGWIDPVIGGFITSEYQPQGRVNPVTGKRRPHNGVDISTLSKESVPLYATKDGVIVTNQFDNGGYGNWVRFKTDDGYLVGYGHMLNPSPYKVGARIKQGDIIGYMGSTGLSTDIHLDYHVQKDGSFIDPKTVMPSYAVGGTTKAGKALVGEYGKEIILYPDGTAGLLGENGMEYADLPAGAHIIPAEETAKILNNPVDKRIPAYAEGTELQQLTGDTLSMEKDYLKVTLSPEEISYLKKIYEIVDDATGEVTDELHQVLQNKAKDRGYGTIRDALVEFYGYESLAKRDFKNYGQLIMDTSGSEYFQGLEKDWLKQVFSSEEIVFLKKLFELEDTTDVVTDELQAVMQGRAKDRGYGTIRDVGVEIYGEDGMRRREWETGISTQFTIDELTRISKNVEDVYNETFRQDKLNELLGLWKLDPNSEEYEAEVDKQNLNDIFRSRDYTQQILDDLIAELEEYEYLVAKGLKERNVEYEGIIGAAIEKTASMLEETDAKFQERMNTKIEALEKYYDEYSRKYEKLIKEEERIIETLEGQKSVWETYYGEYNELLDTQHSINKELQNSKTLTQWLDAKTREQVFNEKDYLQYTQMINKHMLEAEEDRIKYEKEIAALGKYESEKIALITEEYQERVELRKKELNILKEEIQLQKKQNALNTALMERNVRVFSGGRWIHIANVENVAKAQEDLEETKYNISKAERELDQTEHLNDDFNEEIRKSKETIADWNAKLAEAKELMDDAIHNLTNTIDIGKGSFQALFDEIDSVIRQLEIEKEAFEGGGTASKTINSSSGGGSVKSNSGGRNYAEEMYILKLEAEAASKAGDTEMLNKAHAEANKIREELGQSDYGANENAEEFKKNHIDKNAAGTRDSKAGLSLVNEKGVELLSTKYGQLIELNPHQKIFNNDQLNYLYDMSREGLNGMNRTVNSISNTSQDNSLTINTLELKLDNVTDTQSFVEGLRNLNSYIKNTHTIQRR